MENKLKIDKLTVDKCRFNAKVIGEQVQEAIDSKSTVSVERTVCRLLGIDGADEFGVPYPNIVIEELKEKNLLVSGAANFFGRAINHTGLNPQQISESIVNGKFDFESLPLFPREAVLDALSEIVDNSLEKISENRKTRQRFLEEYDNEDKPLIYLIVATGNIREDTVQAVAAAKQGADVIAVIRSTGQSLLDYVPYGENNDGFGGTYATQENFKIMREALDKAGKELNRYIRLCNYCSGLCMPEIAAMGAFERLDMMLNDALYGILFRDINMVRTLIDQNFSRAINAYAGVIINTGEDNYLTTADAYESAHTVLASQFINEQLAKNAGLKEEQMGLGHAFEMNPSLENSFVYELAQAQMAKQIFPKAPLKYMPPTKYKTGDTFFSNVQDALFNMITILTGQGIHLLGMPTEAIHTPFMGDRALAIDNASYIFNAMSSLGDEIVFKEDGIMAQRADEVLKNAYDLLLVLQDKGLFTAIEQGVFADTKRSETGGKGLEGVFEKAPDYENPFIDKIMEELGR